MLRVKQMGGGFSRTVHWRALLCRSETDSTIDIGFLVWICQLCACHTACLWIGVKKVEVLQGTEQ